MIGAIDDALAVAAHYDDLDELYRDVWGLHVHHGVWLDGKETSEEATKNLVRLIALRARIQRGARVVDVGCGYGETARMLAADLDARVTAISISRKQIEHARTKGGAEYVLSDWLSNGLAARSADVVLAIESSEHMTDFARFLSEAHRVLSPDGRLVICAWLAADNTLPFFEKHLLAPICEEGRMCMRTRHEHARALHVAGFTLQSFEDLSSRVSRTWTLCIARTLKKLATDPRYMAFWRSESENRHFAKTLLRIRAAYAVGAMRYGMFVARK